MYHKGMAASAAKAVKHDGALFGQFVVEQVFPLSFTVVDMFSIVCRLAVAEHPDEGWCLVNGKRS